jgi:hypothetical protein
VSLVTTAIACAIKKSPEIGRTNCSLRAFAASTKQERHTRFRAENPPHRMPSTTNIGGELEKCEKGRFANAEKTGAVSVRICCDRNDDVVRRVMVEAYAVASTADIADAISRRRSVFDSNPGVF